jgi:hypothetical protein
MGIDIWVERRSKPALPSAPPGNEAMSAVEPEASKQRAVPTEQLRKALHQSAASRREISPSAVAAEPAPQPIRQAVDDFPTCQILAMRQDNMLLLTEHPPQNSVRRLARDLLGSIANSRSSKLVEMRFEWPPEQVSGVVLDGRRALNAFVNRQLDDLTGGCAVLVCAGVSELLPDLIGLLEQRSVRYLPIADLADLAVSPPAKRTLWSRLQQLR